MLLAATRLMLVFKLTLLTLALLGLLAPAQCQAAGIGGLRYSETQMLRAHNSYHVAPSKELFERAQRHASIAITPFHFLAQVDSVHASSLHYQPSYPMKSDVQ